MGTFGNTFGNALGTSLTNLGEAKPPFINDLKMRITSRSGSTLIDDFGNNATIQLPCFNGNSPDKYAYISDNGALDVGSSDFTLAGWVKAESSGTSVSNMLLLGKRTNVSGSYGIQASTADISRAFYAIIKTTGGEVYTVSNVSFDGTWQFVLMEIDQTNKKLRLYVNNDPIGSEVGFTGTFSVLPTSEKFYVGAGNNGGMGAVASHADTYIYKRLLTATEKTNLYNRQLVATPLAYWPLNNLGLYNKSGNYHLINNSGTISYYSEGSQDLLNNGYTYYENSYGKYDIPLKLDGTELSITETTSLNKIKNIEGSSMSHNLADSKILFTGDEWDRSNTTIYLDIARSLKYNYYSAQPKLWDIDLLNNLLFQSWTNTNYKGLNFVKITDHSYKDRKLLQEIITYNTNKTGSSYSSVISWAKDYVFSNIYENDYLYWELSTINTFAVNGSKALRFSSGTIYLSLDNGVTWPYSKAISGAVSVQMGFIFDNSNIVFAVYNGFTAKIYLSTDNLSTITEVIPKDINGNNYTPATVGVYQQAIVPIINSVGTREVFAWAVYNTGGQSSIWYSVDYGATIKQAYLPGTTIAGVNATHLHGVVFNPNNNTFWVYSGDIAAECNIIEGSYNDLTDVWSWNLLYTGGPSDYYKIGGVAFVGDYIYWASDCTGNAAKRTIYRCLYSGFNDTANYEKVMDNGLEGWGCSIINGDLFSANTLSSGDFRLLLGKGMTRFYRISLFNKVLEMGYHTIAPPLGINNDGWIIFNFQDDSEASVAQSLIGDVLKVKVK